MRVLNAVAVPAPLSPPQPRLRQRPKSGALPRSFQEALKLGWSVVKEESAIDIKDRQRKGAVLLRLRNAPTQLRIPYTATAKEWKFGTPQPIE